ncbi:hypothetical protein T492DRAFT_1102422 [Pavlovales sp. CCMP2436]|nr:hypothetical protein T492DRAFT_1102422 [Pavlovales sp. CCMP2436]
MHHGHSRPVMRPLLWFAALALCSASAGSGGGALPPSLICCGFPSQVGESRPLDLPVFMINMDHAPIALRTMSARLCPLLAAGVCAHRVPAATPVTVARAGFAQLARPINASLGGDRMALVEVAISYSHLSAASLARALYPDAKAVLIIEDDMVCKYLYKRPALYGSPNLPVVQQ